MAISVIMPALEMAQETGKILSWRKKEGDRVTKGEALLEIETDKAVVEIEATGEGILAGVTAPEGAVVAVGQTIAWLVQPGEAPPKATLEPQSGRHGGGAAGAADERARPVGGAAGSAAGSATAVGAAGAAEPSVVETRISPKARRLAGELHVDLRRVRGSGAGGEILAADIEAAAKSVTQAATPPAPSSSKVETPGSIGRLMAERMTLSWTTVPQFFVMREVEAGALVTLREKIAPPIAQSHGVKPTLTDMLAALVARVLKQHPRMNASWNGDGGILIHKEINVGIAVAVEDGVVVGVIHDAAGLELGQIAVQRRDLSERAKANRLRPSDITGATFTISNLGMYHVDAFTAIVVPPQAGILAIGAVTDRVAAVDGRPAIRPMMAITLSCDHRVVDGARAAAFLEDVAGAIRQPEKQFH
jgi:pyruvate dehydrogenase E2 component (dihydrolipoyllysine-residue acetyltransferase)